MTSPKAHDHTMEPMEPRTRSLQAPPTTTRTGTRRRELTHAGLTWIDVAQPAAADVAALRERFRFDPLALEDVLSTLERPKLELLRPDEQLFAIVQIPTLDRDSRIVAGEVDVFVGRDVLVTLHDGDLKPLRRMFAAVSSDEQLRAQLMGRGPGYLLYRLLDTLTKQCFPILYRVDDDLGRLDARLAGRPQPGLPRELAELRRDHIALRHILLPNLAVLDGLRSLQTPFLQIDCQRYFGDCADLFYKLAALLDEQRDVIEGLSATLQGLTAERTALLARLAVLVAAFTLPLAALLALAAALPIANPLIVTGAAVLLALLAGLALVWYARRSQLL
jgi:magnesium transporter